MSGSGVPPADKHHYHCFPQPPSWSVRIILPPVTCFPVWEGKWKVETDEHCLPAKLDRQNPQILRRYAKTRENKLIGKKDSFYTEILDF